MLDSLTAAADSVADTLAQVAGAVSDSVAGVVGQVDGDPYSFTVVSRIVFMFTALLILKFIVECIINKKIVIGAGTSPYAYKYKLVLEALWVLIIIATGITARIVAADGTNYDDDMRIIFISIGILSAGLVGFFVSEYLTGVYKGTLNKPLYYINKIITEWTWVCWLFYCSGSFISNFISSGCGDIPLTWENGFNFAFIMPIVVILFRFSLIVVKSMNRVDKPL